VDEAMIALDLSRLLSRAWSATPSGIDRVELAYARHVLAGERPYCFAAFNAMGRIGALPVREAGQFVNALSAVWRDGAGDHGMDRRRLATLTRRLRHAALLGGEHRLLRTMKVEEDPVYLLVSHHHLDRRRPIARLKNITGARVVCFIHDLIPLDLPGYTRPSQTRRHRRRVATTALWPMRSSSIRRRRGRRCNTISMPPKISRSPSRRSASTPSIRR
jgi:hypothetical protein